MSFKCVSCDSKFTRKKNLDKHFASKHSGVKNVISCFLCGKLFSDYMSLGEHHSSAHKSSSHFELRQSAFDRNALVYRYIFDNDNLRSSVDSLCPFLCDEAVKVLQFETAKKNYIKFSSIFIAQMVMLDHQDGLISKATIPFRSKAYVCVPLSKQGLKKSLTKAFNSHHESVENFINNGSNWVFERPIALDLEIAGVSPLLAGTKSKCVRLENVPNTNSLLDVPSRDEKCFLYCVAWFLEKSVKIHVLDKAVMSFNITRMKFPVGLKDIKTFVKQNSHLNLNINIFFHENRKIYPLRTNIGGGNIFVNLLMISTNKEASLSKWNHFIAIKNLDRFLTKLYVKNGKKTYKKSYFCPHCVKSFSQKFGRDKHTMNCAGFGERVEVVPEPGRNEISFRKYENQFKRDLVGYLDFECELVGVNDRCATCDTSRCKCDLSYTRNEQYHRPICFSFVLINKEGRLLDEKSFVGHDAGDYFISYLLEIESNWIRSYLNTSLDMCNLTPTQSLTFDKASICYICKGVFTSTDFKVRDHDHSDGSYLGAAHNSCNLRRQRQKSVNIYIHNGSSYDFHFIVKALFKRRLQVNILPHNSEKFRMLKFNSFIILDSLAFLQASLAQLAEDLGKSSHSYNIIRQSDIVKTDGHFDDQKFEMILQKGFFCYDYW